jgi:hypothetical protein
VALLRLSSERRAGSLIVTIVGDLDLVTSARLDEHLAKTWREASRAGRGPVAIGSWSA